MFEFIHQSNLSYSSDPSPSSIVSISPLPFSLTKLASNCSASLASQPPKLASNCSAVFFSPFQGEI